MIPFEPQKSLLGSGSGMPVQAGAANSAQVAKNTTSFGVPGTIGGPAPATTPAGNPFSAILQSDPGYESASNNATLNAQDAASSRTAAIRAAVLAYGGFSPGFQDSYGDVDAATLQAAQANPFSQLAQNQRSYAQGLEKDRQGEAATGSIFSGQLPTDMGNENYNQGLNLSNLANAFGSAVNGAIGTYTGALDTNRTNMANATETAEQNVAANPSYFAPTTAPAPVAAPSPNRITIPQGVRGSYTVAPKIPFRATRGIA